MAPLPPASAASRCSRPRDLDQFPQAPALPPHPHQVDDPAVAVPEDLPGQPLSLLLTEFFAEYQPQVVRYLFALAWVRPERPVAPPAGGTVADGRRQQR